jgi:lysophospholipase L1-like esterase
MMKSKFLLSSVFAIASVFLFSISAIANHDDYLGAEVLIIGDSLAVGYGSTQALNTPLECLSRLKPYSVEFLAKNGATTEKILAQFKSRQTANPALIFISTAGNDTMIDINKPGAYPEAKTLQEAKELFKLASRTGAQVIYLGLKPPAEKTERLVKVTTLAKRSGAIVFDGMKNLWGNQKFMSDRIHPNDEGYKIVCSRLLRALQ